MDNKGMEHFGEEIRRTVQKAIENQDYEKLNQAVTRTINQAVDTITQKLQYSSDSSKTCDAQKNTEEKNTEKQEAASNRAYGMKYHRTSERIKNQNKSYLNKRSSIRGKVPSKIVAVMAAILYFWLGMILFNQSLDSLVKVLTDSSTEVIVKNIAFGVFSTVFTVGAFGLGFARVKKVLRLNRFRSYLAKIGQKEYCDIKELAAAVEKKNKTVVKDLEYMIQKRWFLQGHLDNHKTCLIVTDQMYEQYRALEAQKVLIQEEEEKNVHVKKEQSEMPSEIQNVLAQGAQYLRELCACNDAIPGEEISVKIYRIEKLTEKIFDRVKQEPKCVSDIEKLMDYYLPTTIKLLEAYVEMDAQPVDGENIQTAKKEIEATLDTLNVAFEKLLDSLFQETAWDVSSDISVLNTVLAQEGLKEDGLKKN